MKKSLLLLSFASLLAVSQVYAEDKTPIEQKIEEQTPAAIKEEKVPEIIKKKPLDVENPLEKAAPASGGAGGKAAKPKPKRGASIWPDDDSKLKLEFTDEADKNSSFKNFREEFLKKLAQKDKAYLLSSIDKGLKFSFGGYNDFKSFYSLDMEPKRSTVWEDITNILKLGGVFTPEGEFCAPYVYCIWPEGVRSNEMAAIVKDNVEIKKGPSKGSASVGTVGYEIVRAPYNGSAQRAGWTQIETKDGRKGYVRNEEARNPADYRAWFKEKDGKWVMTTYMNGGF